MTLRELFDNISYRLAGKCEPTCLGERVLSIVTRAEDATQGTLFVCVRTALGDGHDAAVAAYDSGCRCFLARHDLPLPSDAAILLADEPEALLGALAAKRLAHPARELTVFGIAGSAGKTSVALMTAAVLTRAGRRVATLTTDGARIGDTFVPADNVVPDAVKIQEFLRRAADAGVEFALLEFSSYALAQKSACSIPFAALLLTNLLADNVKEGACEGAAAHRDAERSLFADADAPFLVLPTAHADLAAMTQSRRLLFGEGGDFYAEACQFYADEKGFGSRFTLGMPEGEKIDVSLPVVGDLAVENAICTAVLARIAGLLPNEIAAGLADAVPDGRMECVAVKAGRYVFVDSAYEAKGLARALRVLRPHATRRLAVVMGSVGGRARFRRAPLGETAARLADAIYLTADDPADEDPMQICRDIEAGIRATESNVRYAIIPDRAKAIARAVWEMRPGDVLLLAGKGSQQTQFLRGERVPFSERELVAEAFLQI